MSVDISDDLCPAPRADTVPAWLGLGETVLSAADVAGDSGPAPGRVSAAAHTQPVAYICIGNSDDRLTQEQWSMFVAAVRRLVNDHELRLTIVFEGFSPAESQYQNACWGVVLPTDRALVDVLRWRLSRLAGLYHQDSISWAEAFETQFLAPYGRPA